MGRLFSPEVTMAFARQMVGLGLRQPPWQRNGITLSVSDYESVEEAARSLREQARTLRTRVHVSGTNVTVTERQSVEEIREALAAAQSQQAAARERLVQERAAKLQAETDELRARALTTPARTWGEIQTDLEGKVREFEEQSGARTDLIHAALYNLWHPEEIQMAADRYLQENPEFGADNIRWGAGVTGRATIPFWEQAVLGAAQGRGPGTSAED